MKTKNQSALNQVNLKTARGFVGACLDSCREIANQIQQIKDSLFAEFNKSRKAQSQLLRLALNEAEALARQTDFPQLVFPVLAREKVEAVAAWEVRQHSIQRSLSARAVAA